MIGFILNTRFKVDLTTVRIMGVLQRFAIVYGVLATIEVLCTKPKQYLTTDEIDSSLSPPATTTTTDKTTITAKATKRLLIWFRDIINFPLQWLIILSLVTIWVLLVYLVPFENCPAGYLGPGKE